MFPPILTFEDSSLACMYAWTPWKTELTDPLHLLHRLIFALGPLQELYPLAVYALPRQRDCQVSPAATHLRILPISFAPPRHKLSLAPYLPRNQTWDSGVSSLQEEREQDCGL